MKNVELIYHNDTDGLWCESPDIPGFSATADDLPELRHRAREAVALYVDGEVDVRERMASGGLAVVVSGAGVTSAAATNWAHATVEPRRGSVRKVPVLT